MFEYTREYQPYIQNGRLYLPDKALRLLVNTGLESHIADAATRGLALAEVIHLDDIHTTFEQLLGRLSNQNSPALL